MKWSIVQKKAIQDDGSLLFPERLTKEFLDEARKTMGSYMFANQYQNEVIPLEAQTFKRQWFRYYAEVPELVNNFAFIDPAISEADTADFTAWVVISVDVHKNWYVRVADHAKINPSQIIELMFKLKAQWKVAILGVEDVAFQQSILYFANEEMRRRGVILPMTGIKRGPKQSKQMRILSLVPRFEWGSLFLRSDLYELEKELGQFPRGAHDDILDALSSLEEIVYYPVVQRRSNNEPPPTNSPEYEKWYIRNLASRNE